MTRPAPTHLLVSRLLDGEDGLGDEGSTIDLAQPGSVNLDLALFILLDSRESFKINLMPLIALSCTSDP